MDNRVIKFEYSGTDTKDVSLTLIIHVIDDIIENLKYEKGIGESIDGNIGKTA
jgi:hypothetical protein